MYILVNETITLTGAGADDAVKWLDKINKGVIFRSCAPFTEWISELNNSRIDNTKYIDVATPTYKWIEYSNDYLKTSERLWQYKRNDPKDNKALSE